MTDQQHLITPPQDKVYKWWEEACKRPPSSFYEKLDYVAEQAAQWGANQELDACCEWVSQWCPVVGDCPPELGLRAARRPQPPSLAEEALKAVTAIKNMADDYKQFDQDVDIIHRALERLQELEGQGND